VPDTPGVSVVPREQRTRPAAFTITDHPNPQHIVNHSENHQTHIARPALELPSLQEPMLPRYP
ncbi:MAG: hypothetical protein Q4E05_00005, partial [Pseudoclavibacter sp.]|nr:hypothetical protein [Pseudoclavibacter sp.]